MIKSLWELGFSYPDKVYVSIYCIMLLIIICTLKNDTYVNKMVYIEYKNAYPCTHIHNMTNVLIIIRNTNN